MDDLRGTPMSVGTLEEIIDDNHAIVSTSVGSEHYVSILSFVDKDLLEPGCSVLLNHKVSRASQASFLLPLGPVRRCSSGDRHCFVVNGLCDPRIPVLKLNVPLGACCDRGADGRHGPLGHSDEGGKGPAGDVC